MRSFADLSADDFNIPKIIMNLRPIFTAALFMLAFNVTLQATFTPQINEAHAVELLTAANIYLVQLKPERQLDVCESIKFTGNVVRALKGNEGEYDTVSVVSARWRPSEIIKYEHFLLFLDSEGKALSYFAVVPFFGDPSTDSTLKDLLFSNVIAEDTDDRIRAQSYLLLSLLNQTSEERAELSNAVLETVSRYPASSVELALYAMHTVPGIEDRISEVIMDESTDFDTKDRLSRGLVFSFKAPERELVEFLFNQHGPSLKVNAVELLINVRVLVEEDYQMLLWALDHEQPFIRSSAIKVLNKKVGADRAIAESLGMTYSNTIEMAEIWKKWLASPLSPMNKQDE